MNERLLSFKKIKSEGEITNEINNIMYILEDNEKVEIFFNGKRITNKEQVNQILLLHEKTLELEDALDIYADTSAERFGIV